MHVLRISRSTTYLITIHTILIKQSKANWNDYGTDIITASKILNEFSLLTHDSSIQYYLMIQDNVLRQQWWSTSKKVRWVSTLPRSDHPFLCWSFDRVFSAGQGFLEWERVILEAIEQVASPLFQEWVRFIALSDKKT
jgi:hypothetical protein